MKIKNYILFVLAFFAAVTMQAQMMMHVHHTDGTTTSLPIGLVQNVTFGERELPELTNQFQLEDAVGTVGSVTYSKGESYSVFSIYSEAAALDGEQAAPAFVITLANEQVGKNVDLATADAETLTLKVGDETPALDGTLKVSFDKFNTKVTVSLEALNGKFEPVRIKYSGAFERIYEALNMFTVMPSEEEMAAADILSVFRIKPAETGASLSLAFADVEAADVKGMCAGQYAVWFTVSAAKLNTTVDLATDGASCTFRSIDYATGLVDTEVASGTLTTAQAAGDKVYFKFSVVLKSGVKLEADYFGTVNDVESLDEMIPNPVLPNMFLYTNADGNVMSKGDVVTLRHKKSYDGLDQFYFMTSDGMTSSQYCPNLKVPASMINAGNVDLGKLEADLGFSLSYQGFQMTSPDEKYGGYSNVPDNGVLNIAYDEETKEYNIYIECVNTYTTGGYAGGDHSKLVVSFKGVAEEQ